MKIPEENVVEIKTSKLSKDFTLQPDNNSYLRMLSNREHHSYIFGAIHQQITGLTQIIEDLATSYENQQRANSGSLSLAKDYIDPLNLKDERIESVKEILDENKEPYIKIITHPITTRIKPNSDWGIEENENESFFFTIPSYTICYSLAADPQTKITISDAVKTLAPKMVEIIDRANACAYKIPKFTIELTNKDLNRYYPRISPYINTTYHQVIENTLCFGDDSAIAQQILYKDGNFGKHLLMILDVLQENDEDGHGYCTWLAIELARMERHLDHFLEEYPNMKYLGSTFIGGNKTLKKESRFQIENAEIENKLKEKINESYPNFTLRYVYITITDEEVKGILAIKTKEDQSISDYEIIELTQKETETIQMQNNIKIKNIIKEIKKIICKS